jgi:hypothetical protein
VGAQISVNVAAQNPTTGSVIATSNPTSAITPAPADPLISQFAHVGLPTTGSTTVSFGSDLQTNSWVIIANSTWDNAAYNATISDTQGNTNAASSFAHTTYHWNASNNPWTVWLFVKSVSTGPYTLTWNTNGSQGGNTIMLEVAGVDPSTLQDIPSDYAEGISASPLLTASAATTKPKDLVLIMLMATGVGHTFTPDAGWTLVDSISGSFNTLFVLKKKESAIETFTFSGTLDSSAQWAVTSLVVKGS